MSIHQFSRRHIGIRKKDIKRMLKVVKADSVDNLIEETLPNQIFLASELNLPPALTESRFADHMRSIAKKK